MRTEHDIYLTKDSRDKIKIIEGILNSRKFVFFQSNSTSKVDLQAKLDAMQ